MTVTNQSVDSTGVRGEFWTDLRAATVACVSHPSLLVAAAVVAAAPVVLQAAAVTTGRQLLLWIGVLLGVVLGGFSGAKRVWLRRIFDGEPFGASEGFDLTFGYVGRFFRLSLVIGLVSVPVFMWIGYVTAKAIQDGVPEPTWPRWFLLGAILLVDVAFTFVVPELTFNSRSAFRAIGSGIGLLFKTLPGSWPYLLTPGLLVLASGSLLGGTVGNLWVISAWTAVAAVVSLVFAGAILRYYVRLRPSATEQLGLEPESAERPKPASDVSALPSSSPPVTPTSATGPRSHSAAGGAPSGPGGWDVDSFRAAGWSDQQLRALGWFEPAPETEGSAGGPEPETPPS